MKKNRRVNRNFRNKNLKPKKLKANKKENEVTLEEASRLLDEKLDSFSRSIMDKLDNIEASFGRINDGLDRMIEKGRGNNLNCRSINESLDRLQVSLNRIGTYPVSPRALFRAPRIRLVNGADLHRAYPLLHRKIFK